jgi:pyruvate-ferredoxin/flavodoxin oxidoreductase
MAGGDPGALAVLTGTGAGGNGAGGHAAAAPSGGAAAPGWEPVWVDTPACTACDECTTINPKIFRYNADKKVQIADPKGGPFKDIVKAAEKCTAGCIHPGGPWDPSEKGLDKLVKRAEKYQ